MTKHRAFESVDGHVFPFSVLHFISFHFVSFHLHVFLIFCLLNLSCFSCFSFFSVLFRPPPAGTKHRFATPVFGLLLFPFSLSRFHPPPIRNVSAIMWVALSFQNRCWYVAVRCRNPQRGQFADLLSTAKATFPQGASGHTHLQSQKIPQRHLLSVAQLAANRERTLCDVVMTSPPQEHGEEKSPRNCRHLRGHRRTAEQR